MMSEFSLSPEHTGSGAADGLLATKMYIPRTHPPEGVVSRSRLAALADAARWVGQRGLSGQDEPDYLREFEHLTLARLLIVQGRQQPRASYVDTAARLLERLRQATESAGRLGRTLEVLILQALTNQARGQPEQALATLEQALTLARPAGYLRLFIDEGSPLEMILRRAASRGIETDYVNKLLAAFGPGVATAGPRTTLVEPLSERELEILHLVAAGLSNRQIAQELVLTVGTVKWHLNNIYGKLNVRSRTRAVAEARDLKLL